MAQNIGQACLQTIASIWQAGKSSIKWLSSGFDWTPGSHLVRVRASPDESGGRWRISVETSVLKAVPLNAKKFIAGVAAQSAILTSTYSTQYPPIWDEELPAFRARLTHFSSIYVDVNLVSWLPRFFAQEALVQVINAELQSTKMSELIGGKPDFLPSGKHNDPDEILEIVGAIYVPEGKKPSRWANTDEFTKVAETYGRSDYCFGLGDPSGLTLEVPFGEDTALIRLRANEKHPQLGSGLLATIQIRLVADLEELAVQTARLNFMEANSAPSSENAVRRAFRPLVPREISPRSPIPNANKAATARCGKPSA